MSRTAGLIVAVALAGLSAVTGLVAAQGPEPTLKAVGTEFELTSGGQVWRSRDLVGAVLTVASPDGRSQAIRIESVEPDRADPDILLHTVSVQDAVTGAWVTLCEPGSDGLAAAFPLAGTWTDAGGHVPDDNRFSLICSGGAIGKCVRWGYKPWLRAPNGEALADYHQACVRMVRADYGGDGVGHTRDGTPIDVYDRLGIVPPETDPGALSFEAGWGVDGAVCVRKPRLPDIVSLVELERLYPRLSAQTGAACSERDPRALIFNRS
jgi:hypothetical protein